MSEIRPKADGKRKAPKSAFKPGQSGNPGGRRKLTPEEFDIVEQCKLKTPQALLTIETIMLKGASEKNRLAAAQVIIERAYGKPKQEVAAHVTGQIQQIIRKVVDPK